jgi:hypothetical protein
MTTLLRVRLSVPHESIEPNVCVSNFNWPLNGRVALTRLAWTCAFGPVAACDIRFRVPNLVFTRQADRTRRSHTSPCQPLADTHILVFISTLYLIIESSFDASPLASLFVSPTLTYLSYSVLSQPVNKHVSLQLVLPPTEAKHAVAGTSCRDPLCAIPDFSRRLSCPASL